MYFAISVLCERGRRGPLSEPGFPMYESISAYCGATPVAVPLREENGFRMDPDEVASLVTDRTKLLILNSPQNPCGTR